MMSDRIQSFREFWPFYLHEHGREATRRLHFIGTSGALVLLITSVLLRSWGWIIAALVWGYGLAWIGHFFVERNRPATFRYPFWSLVADWKMWSLMLSGRLGEELERVGARPGAATAAMHSR
jgi:hypothetical protein